MPEPDRKFAFSPSGRKAHIVDFGRLSMLALGHDDTSDYSAACGLSAAEWEPVADDASVPDPQICTNCADRVNPNLVRGDADV
jgi:hypothetical protein